MPTHDPNTITAALDLAPHTRVVLAAAIATALTALATATHLNHKENQ